MQCRMLLVGVLLVDTSCAPMVPLHPAVKEWAQHSAPYSDKVAAVIKRHGEFGGNGDNALGFIKDLAGTSNELVDTLGVAAASLPNSYPLPLCAHGTREECVTHRGCEWDTYRHCYTFSTLTPSNHPATSASSASSSTSSASSTFSDSSGQSSASVSGPLSYEYQVEHAVTPASPYDGKATAPGVG